MNMKRIFAILMGVLLAFAPIGFVYAQFSGLSSYYPFSGNSNDEVGSVNGSDTSMSYSSGCGLIGEGACFSGTGVVDLSVSSWPSGSSARTFNVWIKPVSLSASQDYIFFYYGSQSTGESQGFEVRNTEGNGHIELLYFGYGDDLDVDLGVGGMVAGVWNMVTGTYDGTTAKLYLNGNLVGSSGLSWNTVGSSGELGGFWSGADYQGDMDEVGVWSSVLSGSAITTLYNAGAGCAYPFSCSGGGGGGGYVPPTGSLFSTSTNGLLLGAQSIDVSLKQTFSQDLSIVIWVFSSFWPFWLILCFISLLLSIAFVMRNLNRPK